MAVQPQEIYTERPALSLVEPNILDENPEDIGYTLYPAPDGKQASTIDIAHLHLPFILGLRRGLSTLARMELIGDDKSWPNPEHMTMVQDGVERTVWITK